MSCNQKKIKLAGTLDEKDYSVIYSRNDLQNKPYFFLYQSKANPNLYMVKTIWENGNVQSIMHYFKNVKSGPFYMYDISGNIEFETFHVNDKTNGLSLYYKRGKIVDFDIEYDGKSMEIDSTSKKEIIKSIINSNSAFH